MADKFFKCTAFIVMLLLPFLAIAQVTLSQESNKPIVGDKVERHKVTGLCCGAQGDGVLWDFSCCDFLEDTSPISIFSDSLGFVSSEMGNQNFYILSGDSILKRASRSRLETMNYQKPQIVMTYPFCYGDSISSAFYGKGKFCDLYQLSHFGIKTIIADARGCILLPNNKILRDVLRIHSVISNNILLEGMDSNLVDTATAKQEVTEEYFWYIEGCRYPVFEYQISTSYGNGLQVGSQSESYCCLPSTFIENAAPLDEAILPVDYQILQKGNCVQVSCSTSMDATIRLLIASTMGVIYQSKTYSCKTGENYTAIFDCTGYPSGGYILYVSVNGIVKNEKFQLK